MEISQPIKIYEKYLLYLFSSVFIFIYQPKLNLELLFLTSNFNFHFESTLKVDLNLLLFFKHTKVEETNLVSCFFWSIDFFSFE